MGGENPALTSRMSSSLIELGTSLLFFNTSNEAPINLCEMVSVATAVKWTTSLLAQGDPSARLDSLSVALGLWHQQPRRECQSSRSSSSSMFAKSSDLLRPLSLSV